MNLSPQALLTAIRETLTNPSAAARQVMALRLSASEAWIAIAATAVAATVFTSLMQMGLGRVSEAGAEDIFNRPFLLAVSQLAAMGFGAVLMWRVGRVFGGTGTLPQALSLVAWLEVVLILLNVAAVIVLLVLPVIGALVFIGMFLALFYLLTHFTMALHGFTSLIKTLIAIVLTSFFALVVISLLIYPFVPVPHV